MPQEVRNRGQRTITFEANSKIAEPMSRGMVYREIYLTLSGQPTLVLASNTQAATLQGDEWAVIKRIDLIANNTDVLRSLSGNQLWWLNYFLTGVFPAITPTLGDATTDNPEFESCLMIPLWMPRCMRPMDTALDARELSDLKIEITWGDYADINAAATAWTVEPKVEIDSLESFRVAGPFSQWRTFVIEDEITATNPQFKVRLPVGPMYRGFLLNFTDAGKDAGTILNNFKIISGTTVYADRTAEKLHQISRLRSSIVRLWDDGGAVYDPVRRGSTYNSLDGWYFYDHVTDGYLTESIDTLGFSEFEIELDVTVGVGTTKAFILPIQIIPVRGQLPGR